VRRDKAARSAVLPLLLFLPSFFSFSFPFFAFPSPAPEANPPRQFYRNYDAVSQSPLGDDTFLTGRTLKSRDEENQVSSRDGNGTRTKWTREYLVGRRASYTRGIIHTWKERERERERGGGREEGGIYLEY